MLKLSTGVILAMGTPLWAIASAVGKGLIGAIVAVVRTVIVVIVAVVKAVCAVLWWMLRWLGGHAATIGVVIIVAALIGVAAFSVNNLVVSWVAAHEAEMEATKEERAFSEALEAATEEAERLQIRQRVRQLELAGAVRLTVGDRPVSFFTDVNGCVVTIDGVEVYRHTDFDEAPAIYRGLGEWEHTIDAAEAWVTRTERESKFGGIGGD